MSSLLAQTPLDDLIFTVGTTTLDTNSQPWSYVLLGSPQASLLAGKKFAVYAKPNYPTNAGTYTLRATIFQQSDPSAITSLLNQSLSLGEDLTGLSNSLNVVFHRVSGFTNLPLAQKIATGFQIAAVDPSTAQTLSLVGRMHPGLMLSAGQAFAEQISGVVSYELREVNPATGVVGDVAGRVTVVPGSPVILPAPGAPFQVVSNGPIDHLRIRLRWGTPDALRRLSLLSFGYNVWRIARTNAESAGYDTTPPTLATLYSDPNFTRANNNIVTASKDYSSGNGAGAANDPADPVTAFFTDDNGHSLGTPHFPTNSPPHIGYLMPPFNDGQEFYYFITARDVLGRDGLVSTGTLARACRRLAPQAPTDVRVSNSVMNTNQVCLAVSWQQNTNAADAISEYWVYRWPNPRMALTNDATPLSNRVGVVGHLLNTNRNYFIDNGSNAPAVPGPSNFWYTVRAVSHAACADVYSPNSGPASGVLRDRSAPLAATGNVLGSCGTPVAMFQTFNMLTNESGPDPVHYNYRLTVQRRDPGIAWVQFAVIDNYDNSTDTLAQVFFPPEGDLVQMDYSLPNYYWNYSNAVTCVVGTFYGQVSAPATAHFNTILSSAQRQEAVFLAGQLLETALDASDPLLIALNGFGPYCFPASNPTVNPSGTVGMTFGLGQIPLVIQVLESNVWKSLGIYTPDSNGVYWVSYPACLVGPPRSFQGCLAYLPASSADCAQHIARANDNGPVAPIRVRFGLTPRTQEYRLYRSVNGGPLTLIAQGAASYGANPAQQIVRTDDAMPSSPARLCYFVQLLDANGNGSPMSFIGCKDSTPPKPPRPVLAEPLAVGDLNNPQVALNWFCPTAGVYRFQIKIERSDQPGSGLPTGISSSKLVRMAAYDSTTRYTGLTPGKRQATLALGKYIALRFDEAHLTPPIGTNFGPGPQFSLNANVVANVPYNISVAAMDAYGNYGDGSQVWKFTWVPPIIPANVPWPARPMPPVKTFDDDPIRLFGATPIRVAAALIYDANARLDMRNPVGIAIGDFNPPFVNLGLTPNAGNTNFLSYYIANQPQGYDPNKLVWTRFSSDATRRGDPLLPIVVYRQQVTNAAFPRVSGHMTQVTPLLERIPWTLSESSDFAIMTITDRLICGGQAPNGDGFSYYMFLRDQQPAILGASYQYFVARLNDKHEVAEVIPAGVVTIPANP